MQRWSTLPFIVCFLTLIKPKSVVNGASMRSMFEGRLEKDASSCCLWVSICVCVYWEGEEGGGLNYARSLHSHAMSCFVLCWPLFGDQVSVHS